MKTKDILKKAKDLQENNKARRADTRYRKVLGFLTAKGLLFDETIEPRPNVKLNMKDVLWVAEKIEPRVFEVLPAAFLHFTKTFFNLEVIPDELREVIEAIRLQRTFDGNFRGIEFKKMNHWANHPLKDQRVKPLNERKVPKSYRLRPEAIESLKEKAHEAGLNETAYLEKLILGRD